MGFIEVFKENRADAVKRIKDFEDYKRKIERDFQLEIVDVLKRIDATSKKKAFVFDEDNRAWFPSSLFTDDIVDTSINKVWLNKNMIRVELTAYYLGETLEDVNYAECEIDNSYFLSVLLSEIEFSINKMINEHTIKKQQELLNKSCEWLEGSLKTMIGTQSAKEFIENYREVMEREIKKP